MTENANTVRSSKRIVKNTLFLYLRVVVLLFINLYITRALLKVLGVVDFGVYNLIGSLIVFLTLFNGSVSGASQRYIAFELGRGRTERANLYFSASIRIFAILCGLIFLVGNSVGLWFVLTKLQYPPELRNDVLVVYQGTLFTCILHTMLTPYTALLVATEHLSLYAAAYCLEGFCKLCSVFLLFCFSAHRIAVYSVFVMLSALSMIVFCVLFTKKYLKSFSIQIRGIPRSTLRELSAFSFWYIIVGLACVAMSHGLNVLLNLFFGPAVNASYAIAIQVNGAIMLFVTNLRMAMDPQLIKIYAASEFETFRKMFFAFGRVTIFLLMFFLVPVFFNLEYLLHLWLGRVPDQVLCFCRLILLYSVVQTPDLTFGVYFKASGKIRANILFSGCCYLMVLPVTWFLFRKGLGAEFAFYMKICAAVLVSCFIKMILLKKYADYTLKDCLRFFFFPCILITGLCLAVLYGLFMPFSKPSFARLFLSTLFWGVLYLPAVFYFGLPREFRKKTISFLQSKLSAIKGKLCHENI